MNQTEKKLHELQKTIGQFEDEMRVEISGLIDEYPKPSTMGIHVLSKMFLTHIALIYRVIYKLISLTVEIAKKR